MNDENQKNQRRSIFAQKNNSYNIENGRTTKLSSELKYHDNPIYNSLTLLDNIKQFINNINSENNKYKEDYQNQKILQRNQKWI